MIYLDAENTRASLPMADAIEAMEAAFSSTAEMPLRMMLGNSLVMPGRVADVIAIKVVSTVPGNPVGLVAVFGPDGAPVGLVDGPTITSLRTGAICGLATRLLAPEDAGTLAMLGAGAMAFDQVEAMKAVRPISRVLVWSRSTERAAGLATRVLGEPVADPDEAVSRADVISCATPATTPLFSASSVRAGAHLNAVGAFTPEMAELPPQLLKDAFVVVDDLEAALSEAGDLIQAKRRPDAALRDLLSGGVSRAQQAVTVFKSVGVAIQDVAAADRALRNAAARGIGTVL